MSRQANHGHIMYPLRDLGDVVVEYERDGDEFDWWMAEPRLRKLNLTLEEATNIADAVWDASYDD